MAEYQTLKLNSDFRRAYGRGKSAAGPALVTYALRTGKGSVRVGITTGKKLGNAVTRNRIRRCMREDVRLMRTRLKCGKYIFIARPALKSVPHAELTREMHALLTRAKLMKEDM